MRFKLVLLFVFILVTVPALIMLMSAKRHRSTGRSSKTTLFHSVSQQTDLPPQPAVPQPPQQQQPDASTLRERALQLNFKPPLHNADKFGEHPGDDDSVVIVIQAHARANFLAELLRSLRAAKGIEEATLVVSTDLFDDDIERQIGTIDFCRYHRIHFPFAMQLYPSSFPGEDANDCPRDLSRDEAESRGCNNAASPDMYQVSGGVVFTCLGRYAWIQRGRGRLVEMI